MDWLKKYKFKNNSGIDCLYGENLSNFEYINKIIEEEFLNNNGFLRLKIKNSYRYGYINKNMVEKDLKELRKDKLDGLVKKV
jgi:hypothetical protein